ncbi:hypothetical protein MKW94_009104 [Papaver nudicaule]|uniref:RING-type E3 ubiquitin transferase n=1 Tax=Papaver nudicaule TaxID=74823 RepID=A0AA42B208_PAPNU|nr:hypothetical protein [Papaver nudicaule]
MSDDDDNRRGYGPWDSDRHGKFNDGRIMITAVICLFVVIALVIMLHIYARCAFRRHARRRAALRQFAIGTTQSRLNEQEPKRGGLNPLVISSLPSFVYKQVDYHTDHTIECSVCISSIEDEEIARVLPNCKHTFHAECVDMWLTTHSTCPVCRMEAEPSVQQVMEQTTTPTAPPENLSNHTTTVPCSEGTSDNATGQSAKMSTGSTSRLSSFRRMLSREISSRRIQPNFEQSDVVGDIERQ